VNILNLNCDVMHARPAFREKLADGSFGAQRLQQLDVSIAECKHAHPDALLRDFLCRINFQPERIAPNRQTLFDAFSRDSDVINFQQPE